MTPLVTCLLDLVTALSDRNPLTIGGGFGLYLKRLHLERTGTQTLFDVLPEARSTNDLDVFLRADLLADAEKVRALSGALEILHFLPVPGSEYMQWVRQVGNGQVKLDLLVGPFVGYEDRLRADKRRVRPKVRRGRLHAHRTDEAVGIEDRPLLVDVAGTLSDGTPCQCVVQVPSTFPYLVMKLHAFADRVRDDSKDLGRHHALDVYTIVGLLTAPEEPVVMAQSEQYRMNPAAKRAANIVAECFQSETALGVLRLREHPGFRPEFRLTEFLAFLADVFLPSAE